MTVHRSSVTKAPRAVVHPHDHLPRNTPRIDPTDTANANKIAAACSNFCSLINLRIRNGRYVVNSSTRAGIFLIPDHSDLVSRPAPTRSTPCLIINRLNIAERAENSTDTAKAYVRALFEAEGSTPAKYTSCT